MTDTFEPTVTFSDHDTASVVDMAMDITIGSLQDALTGPATALLTPMELESAQALLARLLLTHEYVKTAHGEFHSFKNLCADPDCLCHNH